MRIQLAMLGVLVSIATGCAYQAPLQHQMNPEASFIASSTHAESRVPQLIVEAHPRVGFAPLRVTVRAVLQNASSGNTGFGCLWESWSFGDGAVSSEKNNCDTAAFTETEFIADHVYKNVGVYQLQFVLGNNQVVSRRLAVRVMGRN